MSSSFRRGEARSEDARSGRSSLALLTLGTTFVVHAQNPMTLRWDKAAPFPEPEEELYGVTAGGKMYVIGGFSENGKPAPAMVYEYDPAADKWTKKKPIPVPVHHQAQTELNGKIYVFGGCQRPLTGPGMGGWQPVDNAWEVRPGDRRVARARADADASAARRSPSRSTARST